MLVKCGLVGCSFFQMNQAAAVFLSLFLKRKDKEDERCKMKNQCVTFHLYHKHQAVCVSEVLQMLM